jgi:AraC-like DNA-binding protein
MDLNSFSPYIRYVRHTLLNGMTPAYVDTEYVFTYIQSGKAVFLLGDNKYSVKKDDVILMPPYLRHIITPSEPLEQHVVHFDLYYKPERKGKVNMIQGMSLQEFKTEKFSPENNLASLPIVLSLQRHKGIMLEKLLVDLKKTHDANEANSELRLKSTMLEVLWIYMQSLEEKSIAKKHPKTWVNIERAIDYIHENYMYSIEIKDVCKHAGLSLNYFCNMFKQCTHSTPHYYINAVRIKEAKDLMESSDYNFSEIAQQVGFSNIYVFSKVFKKIEGVSPSGYLANKRRQ